MILSESEMEQIALELWRADGHTFGYGPDLSEVSGSPLQSA